MQLQYKHDSIFKALNTQYTFLPKSEHCINLKYKNSLPKCRGKFESL